ncbi:MAG: hypothetical protein II110_08000, partial [Treponema sp.]|nr:hypothetical protein [Treponema sp.]
AEIVSLAEKKGIKAGDAIKKAKLASYLISAAEKYLEHLDEDYGYGWLYDAAHILYAASSIEGKVSKDTLQKIVDSEKADVETLALCALTYLNLGDNSKANYVLKKIKPYFRKSARGIDISDRADYWKGRYYSFFRDDSERYALCLQLLCRLNPDDELCQHIVWQLLQIQKSSGYWSSTVASARVLTAFDEYIRANNLTGLNFTAEVLLNGKELASGKFKGLGAQPVEKTISSGEGEFDSLPKGKELPLEFKKNGDGNLYYTVSMRYALPAEEQVARDEGICVYTEITDVKTGELVTDGNLKEGNVYREKVVVSSTYQRNYLALRAPVPAGAEILNAAFATTGTMPTVAGEEDDEYDEYDDSYYDRYYSSSNWWLSYRGIYDSEVQYFWDTFPRGHQEVEFMFRAVRKGQYNVPCTSAECMYEPEIFGRSSGIKCRIE